MKLLTINATYSGGGPGNTTEFIHEELLRTNNESVVICALSRKKSDFVHVLYNKFEINVIKALAKIHIKANPFKYLKTRKIKKIVLLFKPDAIHIRVIHHHFFEYEKLFRFLKSLNIPVFFTLHDMWLYSGGCYHFIECKCNGFMNACVSCPRTFNKLDKEKKNPHEEFVSKKNYVLDIKSIHLIGVSKWSLQYLNYSYLHGCDSHLIYNAVDTTLASDPISPKSDTNKKIIIGSANTWSEQKGIFDFIKLSKMLPENYYIYLI